MTGGAADGPLSAGPHVPLIDQSDPVSATWNALTGVYDPELYLDVVSLGLVYDVRAENGTVLVEMTLTTPGCPASESMPEMAREAIAAAVGPDTGVDVQIVWEPPWTPEMMDERAAAELGFLR